MATVVYPTAITAMGKGDIDFDTATVKLALVDTGTYTYNAAHDFYNDVSAGVVGTPVTLTHSWNSGTLDASDPTFSSLSGNTVEAAVVYIDTGNAATSPLLSYHDGLTLTPDGNDVIVNINASGLFTIS